MSEPPFDTGNRRECGSPRGIASWARRYKKALLVPIGFVLFVLSGSLAQGGVFRSAGGAAGTILLVVALLIYAHDGFDMRGEEGGRALLEVDGCFARAVAVVLALLGAVLVVLNWPLF